MISQSAAKLGTRKRAGAVALVAMVGLSGTAAASVPSGESAMSSATVSGSLTSGTMAQADTLEELVAASDYRSEYGEILRFYPAFFGREADAAGALYWINDYLAGRSTDEIARDFSNDGQAEFVAAYADIAATDYSSYLTRVYVNMLGRLPDGDGFDYWLSTMESGSLDRGSVVRWVSANDEYINIYPYEATSVEETVPDLAAMTAALQNAQWSDNVTISINGSTVSFESDGVPSHEVLDAYLADGQNGKYVAGGVDSYDASFSFPLVPVAADSTTTTGNGAIGVAISGAVFFNPYEGDGSATIANDDNETINGVPFIDACGGHPLPNSISYHYHGIPYCITDSVDTPGEHSVLIGYIFDGYPIYGPQDVDGDEPTDLDECMGHFGSTPEFPDGIYHYHVSSQANYITACYHGVSTATGR